MSEVANAYEMRMARWSRQLAPLFVEFAGIEFSPTDRIDVELGWTYFDSVIFGVTLGTDDACVEQGAVSLTSIGVAYRFGK